MISLFACSTTAFKRILSISSADTDHMCIYEESFRPGARKQVLWDHEGVLSISSRLVLLLLLLGGGMDRLKIPISSSKRRLFEKWVGLQVISIVRYT